MKRTVQSMIESVLHGQNPDRVISQQLVGETRRPVHEVTKDRSKPFHVFQHGGYISSKGPRHYASFDDQASAEEYKRRMTQQLSPGDKKYYGFKYRVHTTANAPWPKEES
jgi:hypothetical protein